MDVNEDGGLKPGYKLKLNSYDLGVDIELADAVQRLRFEHPEIGAVVIRSQRDRIFCSGANINMLGLSTHDHKVNFCKFTNETRLAIEDATEHSGQSYICSINGIAAGGGYELALACDQILLADDGSSAVSLPELPLLAVLPGTGGLTRLVDKRMVRRDHADFFCTTAEGMRGKRAQQWRLVDKLIPPSKLADETKKIAEEIAGKSTRPKDAKGIALPAVERTFDGDTLRYPASRSRSTASAAPRISASTAPPPRRRPTPPRSMPQGAAFWPLALARSIDDAMMHLRLNETEIGTWVLHSQGDAALVEAYDALLAKDADELAGARDRALLEAHPEAARRLLAQPDCAGRARLVLHRHPARARAGRRPLLHAGRRVRGLEPAGRHGQAHRHELRPLPDGQRPDAPRHALPRRPQACRRRSRTRSARRSTPRPPTSSASSPSRPTTSTGRTRCASSIEERAGFSPDGLIGMEANLRFAGPETMETKIFSRLSAWQNWIFQRPNATGPEGALKLYGTGKQSKYDRKRA